MRKRNLFSLLGSCSCPTSKAAYMLCRIRTESCRPLHSEDVVINQPRTNCHCFPLPLMSFADAVKKTDTQNAFNFFFCFVF
uniref:Putative secreted protein n=1 Tax=Ixodes ricinus TaxID=34613 RepID=A0A6B0U8C2_IXORI